MFTTNKKPTKEVKRGENKYLIKTVLSRDTIHGFKYLVDENLTLYERIFWAIVIMLAFFGAACHLQTIWLTYGNNLLRTTILSTYYKYANIAFPSVTVCDSSRVDWFRVINQMELHDFIEDTEKMTTGEKIRLATDLKNLLAELSISQFGTPKDLNHIKNAYGSRKLDDLSISRLLRDSVRSCRQVFEPKCWWRNNYFNCCDLFELQTTGYGYCYSFNSDISEKSKILSINYKSEWLDWNNRSRPRKAPGHGLWTGLRFTVNAQDIPSYVNVKSGIVVIIGDPSGFPYENDLSFPKGKFGSIGVWGDTIWATSRLRELPASKRSCLFPQENRILHRSYLRQNCIASCYRGFVQSNCNCSLDFIFYQIKSSNSTKYAPCKTKHLQCLAEYNYAFNNHLSEESIMYGMSEKEVSFCQCPDDCENQKYVAKASTEILDGNPNKVICDVHYERSFGTLYQTDFSFDYLDALVSYGGIAALFLGASLLSVTEIFYYIARRIISLYTTTRRSNKAHSKKTINDNAILFYQKEYPGLCYS